MKSKTNELSIYTQVKRMNYESQPSVDVMSFF